MRTNLYQSGAFLGVRMTIVENYKAVKPPFIENSVIYYRNYEHLLMRAISLCLKLP